MASGTRRPAEALNDGGKRRGSDLPGGEGADGAIARVSAGGDGSTWHRDVALLWRDLADGALVLPLGGDSIMFLNASARSLWEMLEIPRSVQDLVAAVVNDYLLEPDRAREQVDAAMEAFERFGLVVRGE